MPISDDEVLAETEDVTTVGRARKEIWNNIRVLQNLPTADIHRYTFSGSDRSRMKVGTRVDSGVLAQPCTVSDFYKEEESGQAGTTILGQKNVVFYDYEILQTDVIEYPASSGDVWDVTRTSWNSETGRMEVTMRRQSA